MSIGKAICAALLATLSLSACESPSLSQQRAGPDSPRAFIEGIGYVEPSTEVRKLAFKHPGIVGEMRFAVGQTVRQGELLARLRDAEERQEVAESEAVLASAQAERDLVYAGMNPKTIAAQGAALAAEEADLEDAEREMARQDKLRESGSNARAEVDAARTRVKRSAARVRERQDGIASMRDAVRAEDKTLALSKVAVAQARVESAKARLAETELRAPSDGTLLEILRREGEAAHSAWPEPIIVFADTGRLVVRGEFDEDYALKVREEMPCTVYGRGLGETRFMGKVIRVNPVMGKKTVFARTSTERKDLDVIQVLVTLPETAALPIGLEVNVRVTPDGADR